MFSSSQHQKASFSRIALVLFVLFTCVRVWLGPMPMVDTVQAQIPDAGVQRNTMVDEIRRTNQLLTEIKQILTTQTLNVRIHGADNTSTDNKAG